MPFNFKINIGSGGAPPPAGQNLTQSLTETLGLTDFPRETITGSSSSVVLAVYSDSQIADNGGTTTNNWIDTCAMMRGWNPAQFISIGDNVDTYASSEITGFEAGYKAGSPSMYNWPNMSNGVYGFVSALGNHTREHNWPTGYNYFGVRMGPSSSAPWWSYDTPNGWHIIILDAEDSSPSYSSGSTQYNWLHSDLDAHANMPTMCFWHRPTFNDTTRGDGGGGYNDLWALLMQHPWVEAVFSGHCHQGQVFYRVNSSRARDDVNGIRQFVVVSGANPYGESYSQSSVCQQIGPNTAVGALKLTLNASSYSWEMVSPSGHSPAINCTGTQNTRYATTGGGGGEPPPSGNPSGTSLHFTANESGEFATAHSVGFNLHDCGMDTGTINSLPSGDKAIVWSNTGKTPSVTTVDSTFASFVTANANNSKIWGYYLVDEPDDPYYAAGIRLMSDYVHAHAPNHKTMILLTDYPGTIEAYTAANTHCDVITIDPYPCKWGSFNLNEIDDIYNACIAAGHSQATLAPVYQTFGSSSIWKAPTATQLQQILDRFHTLMPNPPMDFCYTWTANYAGETDDLRGHADWQAVMKAWFGVT